MSSGNIGKQLAAMLAVGSFMTRMGIQPGGVLFGGVCGFTAGTIATKDYGLDYNDITRVISQPPSAAAADTTKP